MTKQISFRKVNNSRNLCVRTASFAPQLRAPMRGLSQNFGKTRSSFVEGHQHPLHPVPDAATTNEHDRQYQHDSQLCRDSTYHAERKRLANTPGWGPEEGEGEVRREWGRGGGVGEEVKKGEGGRGCMSVKKREGRRGCLLSRSGREGEAVCLVL